MDHEERKWCVYMHTNKINNKIYIGITSKLPEDRWGANGCNYSKKNQPAFSGAIQKYGWDNFEHIIFDQNLTEEKAKHMEKLLIALYQTNCTKFKNPSYGYNMTDGGDGGAGRVCSDETRKKISKANSNPSEETRRKMRDARIGTHASEETRQKMSKARKGIKRKPHSKEARQKMSKSAKERFANPENNPFYGRKHTEESKRKIGDGHRNPSEKTRKKMSESAKARCTDEWKIEQSRRVKDYYQSGLELIDGKYVSTNNPMYGKEHSNSSKEKMMMSNKKRKEVYQLDVLNGIVTKYPSIRETARRTQIDRDVIIRSCNTGAIINNQYLFSFTLEGIDGTFTRTYEI